MSVFKSLKMALVFPIFKSLKFGNLALAPTAPGKSAPMSDIFRNVYLRRQKFSFQMHTERKIGAGKWSRFMATISGTCVMGLRLTISSVCYSKLINLNF